MNSKIDLLFLIKNFWILKCRFHYIVLKNLTKHYTYTYTFTYSFTFKSFGVLHPTYIHITLFNMILFLPPRPQPLIHKNNIFCFVSEYNHYHNNHWNTHWNQRGSRGKAKSHNSDTWTGNSSCFIRCAESVLEDNKELQFIPLQHFTRFTCGCTDYGHLFVYCKHHRPP